jgi:hypothetical protein
MDIPLDHEHIERIRLDMLELLELNVDPWGVCLAAQSVYMTLLKRFIREYRTRENPLTEEPFAPGTALTGPAIEVFRRKFRGEPSRPWTELAGIAQRAKPSPVLRRMILGWAHDVLGQLDAGEPTMSDGRSIMRLYLVWASGWGSVGFPGSGRPIPLRALKAVRFAPELSTLRQRVIPCFRAHFAEVAFHELEDLRFGQHLVALEWGLLQWISMARAAASQESRVAPADLHAALETLSALPSPARRYLEFFEKRPRRRAVAERLMEHPRFAASMARPESVQSGA